MNDYNELAKRCMKVSDECFGEAKDVLKEASITIAFLAEQVKILEELREDDGK